MMKGSVKRSHAAGGASITDGETLLSSLSAKGASAERKEAEALDLQQLLLEHSSEKSCQEQLGRNSTTTLMGCAQKGDVEGSSSQGSEPSHRHVWQEKGEQTWGSSTPSLNLSSSRGRTAKPAAALMEDADVSSAGPEDTHSAASLKRKHSSTAEVTGEVPAISGSSAADKAAHARALADMAWADARKKAKRAAGMLATAQHAMADELRPAKRQRQRSLREYVGPSGGHVLLGVRISVYWPDDDAFYKGRIVEVKGADDEARVIYDDDMEEWLSLAQERFQWLAPRAQSAGGTPELQVEMAQLGAEGVLDTPHIPDLSSAQPERAPPAEEAIGGRVTVHFAGVGEWCRGEVLAYSTAKQMHHILYEDGESEWACLPKEAHAWVPGLQSAPYPAGLPPGVAVPCDKQAIGWRVAVYWPEDSTLHDGEIVGYDNLSLRHHVRYDCGDQEHLTLDATKVCWIMPPSASTAPSATEATSTVSSPSASDPQAISSSGDMHRKLEPVEELLPFEADLLDEEGVHRVAEAFSEALVPEHAAHGQAPLWWSQGTAQKGGPSGLLVPDMPMRPAYSGQSMMGHGWASHMGSRAAGQGLHSARLSLPDCCGAGVNAAPKDRSDAMLAMSRSLSMPETPFDDLITELGGDVEDDHPLSAGLDTLDMQLPSMDLTHDMQDMLLQSHEDQAGALLMPSAHGSSNYSSEMRSILPGVQVQAEPAVEDFLCPDEDAMTKDGAFLSSCQAGAALGANRLSSKSLASDSTAIRFTLAAQPPAQHTLPLSAAATPESTHQLMKWEMRQPCKAPTPAQALGLTPLPDPSSPADALEATMALRSSDDLAMPTELQCLIAEMNWDV
ncbi:g8486 [Coccomyxa viridis]|uniref:G8486 protein n=1 Tax=Coccomyxa viridis TaxID=1274662 RepID=A0ABP1G4K9_9CHLO